MSGNRYDLTFPENNIYFVEKFNDGTAINTIAGLLQIKFKFDERICNKIINKLIESNDALRIKVYEENNSVYQVVEDYAYEDIEYIDMSNKTEKEIKKYMSDSVNIPFEFINSKLYEFKVIRYNSNTGCIFMKLHHTVSDAWTLMQIINQLLKNYNNVEQNIDENTVAPSYLEYITNEKEYLNSDKYIKDEEFWNNYLNGLTDPISIKTTTSKLSTRAERYSVKLSKSENAKINEYCKVNRVSPYTLFLGALSTYIYRIKENNDFVIGTPILNRSNFREKQMLGMFVSTMPIRMKVEENVKFLDLVKQIGSDTMSLFRHQKYPITKTLEHIHNTTDIKGKIYNIMLSYQNARSDIEESSKLFSTKWLFSGHIQDDLEIHIMDMDNNGVLHINYDYLKDLFEKIEIKYLHTRIMAIIENAIDDIDINVENIRIMSKEEEKKILYDFNNTDTNYPKNKTVIQLFEEQVEKTPNNIALVFENKQMTYSELNLKANKLANYLIEEGSIKNTDTIGVIFKKGIEQIISIIATLKLGLAYLPIEKDVSIEKVKFMLTTSNSKTVLTDMDLEIPGISIINLSDNINLYKDMDGMNPNIINKKDIAYIMYTSGTTGEPKGVMVTNRNVIRLVKNTNYIKFYKSDRIIQTGANAFDATTFEYFGALLNGLALCILSKENLLDPINLEETIRKNKITIMWLTASLFNQMVEINSRMFSYLRVLLIGGESLSTKHVNIIIKKYPNLQIINGYGPTENTTFSACFKIDKKYSIRIPIGHAISNSKCYVVDKKLRLLPIAVEGELLVSGDGVAKGYVNRKELTEEKFIVSPFNKGYMAYKTGDIVNWLPTGVISFIGRRDNQVKIHGFRIELDEIKSKIIKEKSVKDCVLVLNNDKDGNKILIAFVILNKNTDLSKLKKKLAKDLTSYMMPAHFVSIKNIPLNKNGKVNTNELLEKMQKLIFLNKVKEEILDEYEKLIKELFCNILNDKNIYKTDSFFDIGGDSILAIKLAIQISEKFNKQITAKDIFENDTIEKISNYLRTINNQYVQTIPKKQEYYPLSAGQKGMLSQYFLNPNSLYYNIPFEVCIPNLEKRERIKRAIEEVVIKNISLFTKIARQNGEFVQTIEAQRKYEIKEYYVTNEEYKKVKKSDIKVFDIFKDYLFEINMYITENHVNILFNFHHIIFDGTSLRLFFEKVRKVYFDEDIKEEEICFGQTVLLNLEKKNVEESKQYFMNKFSGELPDTRIKSNKIKKSEQLHTGEMYHNIIDVDMYSKIVNFSKEKHITLNNLFFGALNVVISKYIYSEDLIVGSAFAGRTNSFERDILGMFVKTIPVRILLNKEDTIYNYLNNTQKELIETMQHSDYTYDELIKELKIKVEDDSNPLYNIMYIYQNIGIPDLDFIDKKAVLKDIHTGTSKMDIIFEIIPINNNFEIRIEYNTNLYDKKMIENIFIHFQNVVREIITKEVNCKLKDIEMLTKHEIQEIIISNNNIKEVNNHINNIVDMFRKQVLIKPDAIAIETCNEKLTYKELDEKSNIVANYLITNGVGKEDRIALSMKRGCNLAIAIMGIIKTGACYVPIDIEYPEFRKQNIIENGNINLIIVDRKTEFHMSDLKYISYDEILNSNSSAEKPYIMIKSNNLLYIIFTSGTTGKPKAVMIEHKNVVNYINSVNTCMNYNIDNRILSVTTICFDIFIFEFFPTICLGKTLILANEEEQKDPVKLLQLIKSKKVDKIMTTPSRMQLILDAAKSNKELDTVKELNLGGEPFAINLSKNIKNKMKCDVYNCYGPTETTVYSTFKKLNQEEVVTIGKPINNTMIYILDKFDKLAPINQIGEIAIGGLGVARGYYNQKELTSEKFINIEYVKNIIYKTGDIGKRLQNNELICLGRMDNQVKIRGFRLELDEISQKAQQLPFIKNAVTVLKQNGENKFLVIYYTVKKEEHINFKEQILKHLKENLPKYMIPSYLVELEKIPLNNNGKVDKTQLPNIEYKNNFEKEILTIDQMKLLSVFQEVLKTKNISINDNFFEIGGDSILAMNLVLIAMKKNINIEYSMVFKYPTINELNEAIINKVNNNVLTESVKKLDFKNIQNLLNKQNDCITKPINKLNKILLLGSTGFLGIHILSNYLENNNGIVYCIVRGDDEKHAVQRLKERLNFYFNEKYDNQIGKKIIVLRGDITDVNFIKDKNVLNIINSIDVIINAAADVRHFGDLMQFEKSNVESVNNLIELCLEYDKELLHISTTSVSGNFLTQNANSEKQIYTEKMLYIGQNLENNYVYTKFMAEYNILNAICNRNLKAKIMRMGNLMSRASDGVFQQNIDQNAFLMRIKAFYYLKMLPKTSKEVLVEFTPIDDAAKAVMDLYLKNTDQIIYHIVNTKYTRVKDILEVIKKNNDIDIKLVEPDIFMKKIADIAMENLDKSYIYELILDIEQNKDLNYENNIIVSMEITERDLKNTGFEWSSIDSNYLNKFFDYISSIGYFEEGKINE